MANTAAVLRLLAGAGTLLVLSLATLPASAEGIASPAAQALFEEGRRLLQERDYAAACPKLAESQRLDPAVGTLLNLAYCHERLGKTATAYVEYNDALALSLKAAETSRVALARERLAALEKILSRVAFQLPEPAPPGLWVALDDIPLGETALASPIPVDRGAHRLVVGAPGFQNAELEVVVEGEGDVTQVTLPVLIPAAAPVEKPGFGAPGPLGEPAPGPAAGASDDRASTPAPRPTDAVGAERPRWMDLAAGGALATSVAALALGTYFGLDAFTEWAERNRHCPDDVCDGQAVVAHDRAVTAAVLSNVAFAVGAAAGATGIYFSLPSAGQRPDDPQARRARGAAGLGAAVVVRGRF